MDCLFEELPYNFVLCFIDWYLIKTICSLQLVIVEDEVERMSGELMETKKCLVEKDSHLKDLASEVNELQSKLRQSEVGLKKTEFRFHQQCFEK